MLMAISVAVPKDLSGIKTKVAMNLTKRQLICFGGAGAVGIPFYIFTNDNSNVPSPTLGHLFSTNSINYRKFQWNNFSPFTIL